jgi:Aldehyde dehydrogenase family
VIQLLKDALDNDIFAWTTEKIKEDQIGIRCIFILQNGPHKQKYSYELVSQAQSLVVAVVERDANLDFAARALVTARFCLSGKSPYAPDLILVNESVKDGFVEAALREAFRVLAQTTDESEKTHHGEPLQDVLERIKRSGEAKIVAHGANGAVLVVSDRYDYDLSEGCS